MISRFLSHYGMAVVLVALCAYYSWATYRDYAPTGTAAADDVAGRIAAPARVLVVATTGAEDRAFAARMREVLAARGDLTLAEVVEGTPADARQALLRQSETTSPKLVIAASTAAAAWLPNVLQRLPGLEATPILTAQSGSWPTFLMRDNLVNVASQIVVIAVIAIGMTLVILTGGIDLSVGSLVALSAVVTGVLIRDYAGGTAASAGAMVVCALAGIAACAAVGAFSGVMVTAFRLPPFIATLGVMQVASGMAYILSKGTSIYEIPDAFVWLGRGASPIPGVPNAVLLMAILFAVAHVLTSHTKLGRYIYAVGGNAEAARLSGVPVARVLILVYVLSGAMAGLGGVVVASQLKAAAPTYGASYELYVIAAVVVGGTSLSGGSGRVLGTLVGALIIAVIQNGMNLTNVESYRQKVVLGLVILGAVLLDMMRAPKWRPAWLSALRRRRVAANTDAAY